MKKIKFSKSQLKKIARQYKIADIYLFGSRLTGEGDIHPQSDLDIAVRFQNPLPTDGSASLVYKDLGADLSLCFSDYKIDLVFLEEAPLHLQYNIITKGKLIYSQDLKQSCDFVERIVNLYRDYKYFIDEFYQGVMESAAKL